MVVARALASDPRLIVIDEPTIGVDTTEARRHPQAAAIPRRDGIAAWQSTGEGPDSSAPIE